MSKTLIRLATASALLLAFGAAKADLTFYTSQASFMSQLSNSATDSYSDLSATVGHDMNTPLTRAVGGFGYGLFAYNMAAADADTIFVGGPSGNPAISTSYSASILIVDRMTGGANAFGAYFWGASSGDAIQNARINFEVLDAAGVDKTFTFTTTGNQSGFIGVTSNTALKIVNAWIDLDGLSGSAPFVTMDNATLGVTAPVPEPANYALMLGGLAALGAVVRRRKAN